MSNQFSFSDTSIHIKQKWIDDYVIYNITPQAFIIYLSLFRFMLADSKYTFITCIDYIKKSLPETYTRENIIECLKILVKYKLIKLNITRWDQLLDNKGKIKSEKTLVITSIDHPVTERLHSEKGMTDKPVTSNDYYISVHLPFIEYFIEKHKKDYLELICLYVLVLRHKNSRQGCNITYENMENKYLGISKNKMNKAAWKLEQLKFLLIENEVRGKKDKIKIVNHHLYICEKYDKVYFEKKWFTGYVKEKIISNIASRGKKNNKKCK